MYYADFITDVNFSVRESENFNCSFQVKVFLVCFDKDSRFKHVKRKYCIVS